MLLLCLRTETTYRSTQMEERKANRNLNIYSHGKYPEYMLEYLQKPCCLPKFNATNTDDLLMGKVDFLAFSYYS